MIKHIAFSVYPVSDMARARAFYEGTLGLQVSDEYEGHWVEYKPGGMGVFAISDMPEVGRSDAQAGGTIAFEVDDVDAMTATVRAAGVRQRDPAAPLLRLTRQGGAAPAAPREAVRSQPGLIPRRNGFTFL
ncbi:MAG: VOC family protein [Acidobacteria bacterium]|nr:VOC family protein [Acidobacteriota bacterium]